MRLKCNFKNLTNKFEKINFKLEKLSNKLSKVQQDNQLRFEQIEQNSINKYNDNALTSLPKTEQNLVDENKITKKNTYLALSASITWVSYRIKI